MSPSPRPLDGVLVVALEQAVSAPFATRQLADLGARVIKVERPDGGDFTRSFDTLAGGLGAHFSWVNRGKESITLDTAQPAGRAVLDELIARADVFVQNLAPGAAARARLDGDTLLRQHPQLVVCEISGYGSSGPYAERRAYDLLIQAEAAVATVTGSLEHPVKPGIAVADIAAGMYAQSGILAALLARGRTGGGTVVEVAMLDAVAEWMGYAVTVAANGNEPVFGRALSHPAIAPYDGYLTRDGERVVLSVQNDREWYRLASTVLGQPDLAADPRYATNAARVENRGEIDVLLAEVLGALDTDGAIASLTSAGVACARINTVQQLVQHPQLVERERWATVDSPVGTVPTLLPPVQSSTWTPALGPIPALGEHTDAVLRELGRDDEQIRLLHAAGAV
jgi:crotonobetainyl-CoA:carnitine CoA-transferase CaiB-like acyl-CoA transferase